MNCRFTGIGAGHGSVVMSNNDFEKLIDTNDAWISKRTGIKTRKYIPSGSTLKELSASAARDALKMAGVDAKDIDLLIVATSSPEDLFGDAAGVAAEIGAFNAASFDITAACSGFVVGSLTAAQFLETGTFKRALVIGADALSRYLDWSDRGSCILFGDGAGAVVIENSSTRCKEECIDKGLGKGANDCGDSSSCCGSGCHDNNSKSTEGKCAHSNVDCNRAHHHHGLLGFAMHSDGIRGKHLALPFVHNYSEIDPTSETCKVQVNKGTYGKITMNGAEVYKFAVNEVPAVVEESLRNAGMNSGDVDWLVLHQANTRIIEHVADVLRLPKEKVCQALVRDSRHYVSYVVLLYRY
jgi:3-oxoacyl-[acyl-carrier-protein] synthase-3